MIRAFGEFELDDELFQLRRNRRAIKLEPKAFDLLAYLFTNRDRVVGKQELFERLWPGQFVSDSALSYCIKAVRQAVGDRGDCQRVIATVPRRGYRFVAPTTELDPAGAVAGQLASGGESGYTANGNFIGRSQVLATLQRALATTAAGRGQLVLLCGEPGIGKTRTADELASLARARSVRALIGRCHEGEGAPPFWPWTQILRTHLRHLESAALPALLGHGAANLVQLVPELAARLPGLAGAIAPAETEQARFRLFEGVVNLLDASGRTQPLAVILDDLHWADTPSLLLLQFVARAITDSRVLVLATYRDTDVRPQQALTHALGDLVRAPNSQRIELAGLEAGDVARFVERVLGQTPPVSLVSAIHRQTEGNPFFVTEVVRFLSASGQLAQLATGTLTLSVPPTVRDAIVRRLGQLSPACRALLAGAAVLGRDFDIALLAEASALVISVDEAIPSPRATLLDLLDEARAAGIIETMPQPVGAYRFGHALIRETLYEGLSTAERIAWHQRAGEALEHSSERDSGIRLAELAHHFTEAAVGGEVHKGVHYAERAAEQAAMQLAYEDAASQYERALQLSALDPSLAGRRGELLLALGHNQWRAGELARARATYHAAAVAARAEQAPERFARAALGYGGGFRGFTLGTIDPVLIDLLEEASALLPAHDSALRAQVTARQAVALYDLPNSLPRRDTLSRGAVEMAERIGDSAAQVGTLSCRHWAIWGPDNLADRTAAANAMVSLAERVGDLEMALQAHRFRLIDALEVGDIHAVTLDLAACARLAEQLRQPYYEWYVLGFRALQAFLAGQFSDSERFSQQALAIGQRAQSSNISQMYGAQILALRREQGRVAEVEPMLQGLVAQFPTVPSWRCGLLYALAELNRADEAKAQLAILAAGDFAGIPRDMFWLVAMAGLGDVCATLGDVARAELLYRLLLPFRDRNAVNVVGTCTTSIARPLGRLAALIARPDHARQHFEDALAIEGGMGARPLLAHTQHDYAAMLLTTGAASDRDRARQLLAAAVESYEQMGMHSFAQRAAQLVPRPQPARRTTMTRRTKVTPLRRR
ncbi:MAG: AAA family ATPase [Deltaproteobacteria bacterium]|nr:AAA family ATPase [Deltaproteobacteria bacterium]